MTREEAIKELERAFDVLDRSCHMDNRRKEAFNMARVALFTKPCDDAISREETLKLVDDLNDGSFRWACVRTKIAKLPSVKMAESEGKE